MRLRSRTKKLQQQQLQHHASMDISQGDSAGGNLPQELMQMLASRLTIGDLVAASLTCRSWCSMLRQGITRATLLVGRYQDVADFKKTMAALAQHSSVSELEVLLNSRSGYKHTRSSLSLIGTLPQLKHLRLRFLMSNTPKKGAWPLFFWETLDLSQAGSLVVEAPAMPHVAVKHLLRILNTKALRKLKHLEFRLGQQPAGSQLPTFASPSWLLDTTACCTTLDDDHLELLAKLRPLESLRCSIANTVHVSQLLQLTQLTCLTELVLTGGELTSTRVQQLTALRKLRRLSFSMLSMTAASMAELGLDHIRDLDLRLTCEPCGATLEPLFARPPAGLMGLSVRGLVLQQFHMTSGSLAGLRQLTSLQLDVQLGTMLDLTALRAVSGLKCFSLQVRNPSDLLMLKMAPPPPPPKPERVLTGPCQSVGKRHKSNLAQKPPPPPQLQQPADTTQWCDVSALASAWPRLEQLTLSGLPPYAVSETSWDGLSQLSALTSLVMQFQAPTPTVLGLLDGCQGLKQPRDSVGFGMPVLRLEHLPASVQELQLAFCYVAVPVEGFMRAGDALSSVSLSTCFVGSVQKAVTTPQGGPVILADCSTEPAQDGLPHPLLRLLQLTEQLRRLELLNLPWLSDGLLTAVAAQTQLRGLTGLSVLGVGSQVLTHGALLGLTGLKQLRELRWHVGDVLELMPDVKALAELRGLMTLHIPSWLHNQMERWGAYAVLDSLPLADVNVELPL